MPRKIRPVCFQCKQTKAKVLKAPVKGSPGRVYANAPKIPVFCSVRCAANYGLLYNPVDGNEDPDQGWHFCQDSGQWEACPEDQCDECSANTNNGPIEAPIP